MFVCIQRLFDIILTSGSAVCFGQIICATSLLSVIVVSSVICSLYFWEKSFFELPGLASQILQDVHVFCVVIRVKMMR